MARNKHPEVTINRILDASTELFLKKGYEQTTIQDIINALSNLSKGAIYHHFKCKEEIIFAVIDRIYSETNVMYDKIKKSKELSGREKLQKLFSFSINHSSNETIIKTLPNLLKNPKFLAIQLDSTMNEVAPNFIEPIILEGIEDGSIETDYPMELAEVICLLSNIWVNPMIFECTPERLYRRLVYFKHILVRLNVDILDEDSIEKIKNLSISMQAMNENNLP